MYEQIMKKMDCQIYKFSLDISDKQTYKIYFHFIFKIYHDFYLEKLYLLVVVPSAMSANDTKRTSRPHIFFKISRSKTPKSRRITVGQTHRGSPLNHWTSHRDIPNRQGSSLSFSLFPSHPLPLLLFLIERRILRVEARVLHWSFGGRVLSYK